MSKHHEILVITSHLIVLQQSLLSIHECIGGEVVRVCEVSCYDLSVDGVGGHIRHKSSLVKGDITVVDGVDNLLRIHPVVRSSAELKMN